MEKFTVDLDAVLDEFEFHEGQANQLKGNVSPTVSGFFSPVSELGPSSLDKISVAQAGFAERSKPSPERNFESSVLAISPAKALNTRYDIPFSPEKLRASGLTENGSEQTENVTEQADNPGSNGLVFIHNADETQRVTHELFTSDAQDDFVSPDQVFSESKVSTGPEMEPEPSKELSTSPEEQVDDKQGSDLHCNQTDNDQPVIDDLTSQTSSGELTMHPGSFNPNLHPESGELTPQPGSEELTLLPGSGGLHPQSGSGDPAPYSGPGEDHSPTSPEKSLAEEMDELQLDPHFLPPEMPVSSHESEDDFSPGETGLDPCIRPDIGNDDYVDEKDLVEYLKQIEMEKCEEKLIEENFPESSSPSPREDESLRTGARPKQRSAPSYVDDLNPTIGVTERGAADELPISTDDFVISTDDLTPVIGHRLPESPPPYSEVDPMVGSEELKPSRPLTLNLGTNSSSDPDPGETSDDTSVSAGDSVPGAPGETPSNPTGPRLGESNILDGLSEDQLLLGRVQPFWVPDADSLNCMICSVKFTVVKRRHHCRACGKVLCSGCCGEKHKLLYMDKKEGRVCTPCKTVLERIDRAESEGLSASEPRPTRPNPANPMEYCSRVPVSEQVSASASSHVPSVMVPVGVLKRSDSSVEGNSLTRTENKSVIFSDGIRPGGELTELDGGPEHRPLGKRPGRGKPRRVKVAAGTVSGDVCASRMPVTGLPFVSGKGKVEDEEISVWFAAGTSVNFVLNNNLTVLTKRVKYSPINKLVWNFASRGLTSVGQDEVVILLEAEEDEPLPPRDIFIIIQTIYEQAGAGQPVLEMGHITVNSEHLGSNSHGGWLFIRHTFQAVSDLFLPPPPVLFGILVMRWEIPWARVFPLRLMLRLGAEYRYYPAPLVSTRRRKPVYGEIGHTIMNVLADFKNYAYTLPTIRGLVIHMSPGKTLILIPKNRHEAVSKALNNSNDPVLALGANFSMSVDSHLVAMQTDEGTYQTQAINIQHKERAVTGASFVVFNGALKSTANLTAKSSIVEDGIMVQVLPDHMMALRKKLQDMEDVEIGCGPVGAQAPDEVVSIKWVDEDKAFNIGIKSVIDGLPMDGIGSLRIHSGPDMRTDSHLLRWTEVFLIKTPDPSARGREPDPTRVAEGVARAVGAALIPHLSSLKGDNLSPIAVRVTLDQDNVSYEAGAEGSPLPGLYMNNLDNELIPLIHSANSTSLVMELIFHILDQ